MSTREDPDPDLMEPVKVGKPSVEGSHWGRESRQRAFLQGRGIAAPVPPEARQRKGESLAAYDMRRTVETGGDPDVGAHERARRAAFPDGQDWATTHEEDLVDWMTDEAVRQRKAGLT